MARDPSPANEERVRDADRSQSTILAAARDEFAEYGLGGARVDRIAERAGLNKRLIYYYFEDKETLFQAVLEQAYRHIREEEEKLRLLELDPDLASIRDCPRFQALIANAKKRVTAIEGKPPVQA